MTYTEEHHTTWYLEVLDLVDALEDERLDELPAPSSRNAGE